MFFYSGMKNLIPITSLVLAVVAIVAVITMTAMATIIIVLIFVLIAVMLVVAISMLVPIAGRIDIVIPTVLHEVDLLTASIVLTAVLRPFFCMARRDAQINWFSNITRRRLNDDRFSINHGRLGKLTNVYSSIKSRLADINRHANIGSHRGHGDGE